MHSCDDGRQVDVGERAFSILEGTQDAASNTAFGGKYGLPSAIIVYDGDCPFCSRSMRWVAQNDVRERLSFTSSTSATGSELMRRHGIDPSQPSTFLLVEGDQGYVRSDAALRVIEMLGTRARHLRHLRKVPRFVRDAIYDRIALNRRRIVPKACLKPSDQMLRRMIP